MNNWEKDFKRQFACKEPDGCCGGKMMEDHFKVSQITDYIKANFIHKDVVEEAITHKITQTSNYKCDCCQRMSASIEPTMP